jgi:ABC-type ATPase involved in cell division
MEINSIKDILASVHKAEAKLPADLDERPYSCFVGPTGAGKSSLICLLLNFSKVQCRNKGFRFILEHNCYPDLPSIGNSQRS